MIHNVVVGWIVAMLILLLNLIDTNDVLSDICNESGRRQAVVVRLSSSGSRCFVVSPSSSGSCHQAIVARPSLSGSRCCQAIVVSQAIIARSSSGCNCHAVVSQVPLLPDCWHQAVAVWQLSLSGHRHQVVVSRPSLSCCCRHAYFALVPWKIPCLRSLEKPCLSFFL